MKSYLDQEQIEQSFN